VRKRFNNRFQLDANYVWSEDLDDDSNERDPFSFHYYDFYNLAKEYSYSDRDEKHKFNLVTHADLPWKVALDVRMQAHSAQPYSANPNIVVNNGVGPGPLCSNTEAGHRVQIGLDQAERTWTAEEISFVRTTPILRLTSERQDHFIWRTVPDYPKGGGLQFVHNKNNINTISGSGTPLFDFDGFIRQAWATHAKRNCLCASSSEETSCKSQERFAPRGRCGAPCFFRVLMEHTSGKIDTRRFNALLDRRESRTI